MEDLTGRQLGPYQIVASLGEGGMAAVYKAYHPAMERYVALKILPRHFASDPQFITRFKQEARVVAQLQHSHILPVFDFGEADGYTYLVMPFIKSGTLADLLKGEPLPLEQIRQIVTQVGGALNYAHERGLVHRDVKPSNVLFDESGHFLLTDFGLAKILANNETLTESGAVLGTPAYMSPEQGLGLASDRRSDIYSLGVILYELVTGRPPYKAETPMAVMIKQISDPLPPPTKFNPDLPEALEAVILKALAKNPEDRYPTAGAMVNAFDDAVAEIEKSSLGNFIPAKREGTGSVEVVQPAQSQERTEGAALPPRRLGREIPARAVIGVASLIAVISIAYYFFRTTSILGQPSSPDTGTNSTMVGTAALIQSPLSSTVITAGSEQARAFAEPILQALVNRPPDFSDDFSMPNQGWQDTSLGQQAGKLEMRDGVMRFSDVVGQWGAELHGSLIHSNKDFVLQFDTRLVSGDRSTQQKISFHNFMIGNQGYGYDVSLFPNDRIWVFNEFQPQAGLAGIATGAGVVSPVGQFTQVLVIVRGDQAAIYLNGQPVAYYQNSLLDNSGTMTFICWANAEATCEFDNIKLWDLKNVLPSASPAAAMPTSTVIASESSSDEQARTFAEPILKALADRPPDFVDDFSTANKGWEAIPILEYRAGEMEIRDGVLRLSGVLGGLRAQAGAWASSSKDFVIQFDMRLVSGDEYSRPDFIFRNFEESPGIQYSYDVVLYPNGYPGWSLVESKGPQSDELATRFDDISQRGEATQVLIVAQGDQIALYLNRKPVAYHRDSDLDRAGTMLFSCWSEPNTAPATCEFDNVKFWDLKDVPDLP